MSSIQELGSLQSTDSKIAVRQETLQDIQRQLEDTAALVELRDQVAEAHQKLGELQRQQRAAELEVESTREFLKTVEGKLYDGKVTSPKELVNLQDEVNMLKARQQRQEEPVLELMDQREHLQALLQTLQQELSQAEQQRSELEVRLQQQRQQLEEELDQLLSQRATMAATVPSKDLQMYEALLTTKQGKALARVERATCQGCRINLPMLVQQRIRSNQELVQCPSCRRILYMD